MIISTPVRNRKVGTQKELPAPPHGQSSALTRPAHRGIDKKPQPGYGAILRGDDGQGPASHARQFC